MHYKVEFDFYRYFLGGFQIFTCYIVIQGSITNILEENVIQPLLVSTSAIELSAETVKMLLKIDDLVKKSFI